MPKRKRESDIDELNKKLKKLERKIVRARRRCRDTSSDDDKPSPHNRSERDTVVVGDYIDLDNEEDLPEYPRYYDDTPEPVDVNDDAGMQLAATDLRSSRITPPPPLSSAPPSPPQQPQPPPPPPLPTTAASTSFAVPTATDPAVASSMTQVLTTSQEQVPELDPDLMEILGEDPTSTREYGVDIQKDLAIRLNHIAVNGLSKENRKELKEKYLIPGNCRLIKAPTLNPEIRASLIESQIKRDKGIENKQLMISCGLSSLSAAITLLLTSEYKNPELLKLLMDTARTLGDMQHSESLVRRYFILSTVKKELKVQLEKTTIDETLFGTNLPETLKTAKIISKSGADIRSASTARQSAAPRLTRPPNKNLNFRAPPTGRRAPQPPGAPRTIRPPQPAPAPRQATRTAPQHSGSRTSSRQQPQHYRR